MRNIAFVLVVAVLMTVPADAAVRTWLSTNGSDSGPCTRTQPCRTLFAAIQHTDPQGEVAILDSGGYSPATIDQPISIVAPPGVHAAIAPTSLPALTISLGSTTGDVVLRNLYINSQGASVGIDVAIAGDVHLENVVISSFDFGIRFDAPDTLEHDPRLYVKDSIIRNCAVSGIESLPGGSSDNVIITISRSRLEGNNVGLTVGSLTRTSIHDSVLAANFDTGIVISSVQAIPVKMNIDGSVISDSPVRGIRVQGPAVVAIRDCAIVRNNLGIDVQGATPSNPVAMVSIHSSNISQNGDTGVVARDRAVINVAGSLITNNGFGVRNDDPNSVVRLFSNFISGNTTGVDTAHPVETAGHNVIFGNGTDTIGPGLTSISTF